MLTCSLPIPPHSSTRKFLLFLWISPQVSPLRLPSTSLPGQLRGPAYTFPWDLPFLHSNLCVCVYYCACTLMRLCFLSVTLPQPPLNEYSPRWADGAGCSALEGWMAYLPANPGRGQGYVGSDLRLRLLGRHPADCWNTLPKASL